MNKKNKQTPRRVNSYRPFWILVFCLIILGFNTRSTSDNHQAMLKGCAAFRPNFFLSRRHLNHHRSKKIRRDVNFVRLYSLTSTRTSEGADSVNNENAENDRPTIAIIGTGAVGGYYGSRLWESNKYNVKFHMRNENYKTSIKKGFHVTSIDGDIFIPPDQLDVFKDPKDIGPVDWVIVALKSTSLQAIPELIYPLLDPNRTRILAIMNGLIEEDLIQLLQEDTGEDAKDTKSLKCAAALYAGMAVICSNRLGPGRVDHSYAGLLNGGLAISNPSISDMENKHAFLELWEPTSVDVAYEPSLLGGRWRKCLWNLPFNGISVAMGGITVDKIVNDPSLRELAYAVMDETIEAANADLAKHGYQKKFHLNDEDKKKMMSLSDNMGPYRTSTMLDFVENKPMEVRYLFSKPVERARKLGVPVPHLETIVAQIEALQRFREEKVIEVESIQHVQH